MLSSGLAACRISLVARARWNSALRSVEVPHSRGLSRINQQAYPLRAVTLYFPFADHRLPRQNFREGGTAQPLNFSLLTFLLLTF